MAVAMKKPSTWAHYVALLKKDLSQELHTKDMLTSMGLYALLVLVVYGAALAQAGSELDILQMRRRPAVGGNSVHESSGSESLLFA